MFYTFFFFNYTATTEIYTLSLHDALPIYPGINPMMVVYKAGRIDYKRVAFPAPDRFTIETAHYERSEEHTSELQSRQYLVCRLLLEKKKKQIKKRQIKSIR